MHVNSIELFHHVCFVTVTTRYIMVIISTEVSTYSECVVNTVSWQTGSVSQELSFSRTTLCTVTGEADSRNIHTLPAIHTIDLATEAQDWVSSMRFSTCTYSLHSIHAYDVIFINIIIKPKLCINNPWLSFWSNLVCLDAKLDIHLCANSKT